MKYFTDERILENACYNGDWSPISYRKKFIDEAKNRDINCSTMPFNKILEASKARTIKIESSSAELDASKREAEIERQRRIELERKLATLETDAN